MRALCFLVFFFFSFDSSLCEKEEEDGMQRAALQLSYITPSALMYYGFYEASLPLTCWVSMLQR
jgi:hypothetical protein